MPREKNQWLHLVSAEILVGEAFEPFAMFFTHLFELEWRTPVVEAPHVFVRVYAVTTMGTPTAFLSSNFSHILLGDFSIIRADSFHTAE